MKNFWLKRRNDKQKPVIYFESYANIGSGLKNYGGVVTCHLLSEFSDRLWMETDSPELIKFFNTLLQNRLGQLLRPDGALKVFKGSSMYEIWGLPAIQFLYIQISNVYHAEAKIESASRRTIYSEYIKMDPAS